MIRNLQAKGWKRIYIYMFISTPLLMFILEEMVQLVGFSRYVLRQGQMWQEALNACGFDNNVNTGAIVITIILGVFNPVAGIVFTLYFLASRMAITREVMRCQNELWGYYTNVGSEENAVYSAILKIGSRKLALLVIAITLVIFFYYRMNKKPTAKPTGRRRLSWTETDMREAIRKIELDEESFIEFCNINQIPLSGKEKR